MAELTDEEVIDAMQGVLILIAGLYLVDMIFGEVVERTRQLGL